MLFAMRPGGIDGSGGRCQPMSEIMRMTLPQLMYFCLGDAKQASGDDKLKLNNSEGLELKQEVDAKMSDPEFRKQYEAKRQEAIRKAKERLK